MYLNSSSPWDTGNRKTVFHRLSLELGGKCLTWYCHSIVYMCGAATFATTPPGRQLWEVELGAHCLKKATHWNLWHLWTPTTRNQCQRKHLFLYGWEESACLQDRHTHLFVTMVTIHCSNSRSVEDGMLATSGDWAFCWPHWQSAHSSTSMHIGMLFCHSNCMCLRKFSALLHCKYDTYKSNLVSWKAYRSDRGYTNPEMNSLLSQLVSGSSSQIINRRVWCVPQSNFWKWKYIFSHIIFTCNTKISEL